MTYSRPAMAGELRSAIAAMRTFLEGLITNSAVLPADRWPSLTEPELVHLCQLDAAIELPATRLGLGRPDPPRSAPGRLPQQTRGWTRIPFVNVVGPKGIETWLTLSRAWDDGLARLDALAAAIESRKGEPPGPRLIIDMEERTLTLDNVVYGGLNRGALGVIEAIDQSPYKQMSSTDLNRLPGLKGKRIDRLL